MNNSVNFIKDSILAGQPIIQIISFEEKRIEGFLKKMCLQTLKNQNVAVWDMHNGMFRNDQPVPETGNPVAALNVVMRSSEPGFFIFKDLTPLIKNSTEIVRKLRECSGRSGRCGWPAGPGRLS